MRPSPTPTVLLIGPSGAGKSTLAQELARRGDARVLPTWTTRPRRPGEVVACPEHRFVSDAEFAACEAAGGFALTGGSPGLDHRYGLPAPPEGGGPVVIVGRANAVTPLAAVVPRLLVYQVVAPPDLLAQRLAGRGLPAGEVEARMGEAATELWAGGLAAHRVFRGDGDPAALAYAVSAALVCDARLLAHAPGATRRAAWRHRHRRGLRICAITAGCVAALAFATVLLFVVAFLGWANSGQGLK